MSISIEVFGKLKEYIPRDTKKNTKEEEIVAQKRKRIYNKKHYEANKRAAKTMSLISESSEGFRWDIRIVVENDGSFRNKGVFMIGDYEKNAEWQKEHLEKMEEYNKKCRESHVEERKQYRKEHADESRERSQKWERLNPERYAELHRKHTNKRRSLGLEPLNEPFEGVHAHHFSKNGIIYIPAKLHRSVSHNIFTGRNMEKINKLAFEWLDRELVRKAFDMVGEEEWKKKIVEGK